MLCYFNLAALEGSRPSLQNQCRYLSVGGSILHCSGRPLALHPNPWAACLFHSPLFDSVGLAAMTQFGEW